MSTAHPPRTDKELWHSLAMGREGAPGAVSDLDFAAWLEGRLPVGAAARVEAAVAADPDLRRAALDLADILGKPLPAAPARVAVRAQALVGFEVERQGARGGWFGRLLSFGPRYRLQRAAMAAMSIAVAAIGFMVGGGLGESFAYQRYGTGTAQTTAQTTSSDTSTESIDSLAGGI